MARRKAKAAPPAAAEAASKPVRSYSGFDLEQFLGHFGIKGKILNVKKKQCIFAQGGPADAVFYIQRGQVRIGITSESGKEATVAVLREGDFLGEESLQAQHVVRTTSALALTDSTLLRIAKSEMLMLLKQERALSDFFITFLLDRNARLQEDLADQLFNSTEKRLARALLTLAKAGSNGSGILVVPRISQEALAGMIGTTRSRVNMLMSRFKKRGFIHYDGELRINSSLLNVVLHN